MKLYPKRKTDAEHVEFIRKQVGRSKWFLLLHSVAFVFFLAMFLLAGHQICRLDEIMPEFSEGAGHGFIIGVQLGLVAGLFVIFAVINVIFAIPYIQGYRTERLMLKFHDELKKKDETSNHTSDGIRQPADRSPKPSM